MLTVSKPRAYLLCSWLLLGVWLKGGEFRMGEKGERRFQDLELSVLISDAPR
jgi:hypothetical protein